MAGLGVSFSTGLLVEAAAAPDRLPELTRGALKRCVLVMGTATIVLVLAARLILRVYGGSYVAHTVVVFQLLSLSLLPFCIETIAFSLDRIAGKPIRAALSQLAIAVLTLGGSWLLFGRLGLNAVGVAVLGADIAVALVRLPTVLAALRRRPGAIARSAGAPRQVEVPDSPAPARLDRPSNRRSYAGRHRAKGPGENSSTSRQQQGPARSPASSKDPPQPGHSKDPPQPGHSKDPRGVL